MPIALSTAWNAASLYVKNAKNSLCDEITAIETVKEVKNLGFNRLELSFNLSEQTVQHLAKAAVKQNIKIDSLHNYCPTPKELKREAALPDCYSMASRNEEERKMAVQYTKKTIDTANALGAKVVVLHCGRVEIKDRTRELIALYNNGQIQSPEAIALKKQIAQERALTSEEHFQNTVRSLSELYPYAKKQNIKLGIENRFYYREIPSYEEAGRLLDHFNNDSIGYWHDTGHAQVWENLGVIKHSDYLKNYGNRLIGLHLHGIEGTKDHQAPLPAEGKIGAFDFNSLTPYIKKDTLFTIEVHQPTMADDIIKAKRYIEKLFGLI